MQMPDRLPGLRAAVDNDAISRSNELQVASQLIGELKRFPKDGSLAVAYIG